MRHFLICSALLAGLFGAAGGYAQESTPAPATQQEQTMSPVAAAISALPPVCGSFNKNAEYFIYLYSASWCGPCRMVMPDIAKVYKEELSKKGKIEIILLSGDANPDAARRYISHYGVDMLTVMGRGAQVDNLPGAYQVRGIPHAIVVDKNGNRIFNGHARKMLEFLDTIR